MKVYFETLGCPKNVYDTQTAQGILEDNHFESVRSPEAAEVIVVNTCGFINDAKKESIDRIFEMAAYKEEGKKLVVSGCLSQRYGDELFEEMPEVDLFVGVNEYEKLPELLRQLDQRRTIRSRCAEKVLERTARKLDENTYSATLKIAEGCNNVCAYCVIPQIRGGYRSKREEDILKEAEELSAEAKPSTLPPRRIMADSKLRRVRVLGS